MQDNDTWEFKQKQELELQAFLKKQREQAASFKKNQTNQWNDLKERHTQETWKLFGAKAPANTRPSVTNLWGDQEFGVLLPVMPMPKTKVVKFLPFSYWFQG